MSCKKDREELSLNPVTDANNVMSGLQKIGIIMLVIILVLIAIIVGWTIYKHRKPSTVMN